MFEKTLKTANALNKKWKSYLKAYLYSAASVFHQKSVTIYENMKISTKHWKSYLKAHVYSAPDAFYQQTVTQLQRQMKYLKTTSYLKLIYTVPQAFLQNKTGRNFVKFMQI